MQFRRSPSSISRRCERESDSDMIAIVRMRLGWTCVRHDRDSAIKMATENGLVKLAIPLGRDRTRSFCSTQTGAWRMPGPPARTRRGKMDPRIALLVVKGSQARHCVRSARRAR